MEIALSATAGPESGSDVSDYGEGDGYESDHVVSVVFIDSLMLVLIHYLCSTLLWTLHSCLMSLNQAHNPPWRR